MNHSGALRLASLLPALLCGGCAAHAPQTWRLFPQDRAQVLAPPGVTNAEVSRAIFTLPASSWRASCDPSGSAVGIQRRGKRIRVAVDRAVLLRQPAGWLAEWTAAAEQQRCVAQGAGLTLATRILDSVPLDPAAAHRLMHSDNAAKGYVDLGLQDQLQVHSPILKPGGDPNAPIVQTAPTTGDDGHLNVELHLSDAVVGFETAWYAFRARPDGVGSKIVALSAERTLNGHTEPAAAPLVDYFQFAPDMAFYRLFYKTDPADNGITEIVIAAPTRAELDRRTELLRADASLCSRSDPEICMVIPRRVAVNPFMTVTVNGAVVRLATFSRVRNAIQAAGGRVQPLAVIPQLTVAKPFGGVLKPVVFDSSRADILDLVLLGGESISWTGRAAAVR